MPAVASRECYSMGTVTIEFSMKEVKLAVTEKGVFVSCDESKLVMQFGKTLLSQFQLKEHEIQQSILNFLQKQRLLD